MCIWTCRYLPDAESVGLLPACDICPILSRDLDNAIELILKVHGDWFRQYVNGLSAMNIKQQQQHLKKILDIKLLVSGIWADKDFITNDITTPIGF
jgi:hypothetical protein